MNTEILEPTAARSAHRIASREEWLEARRALLLKEKEHTRRGEAINAQRRQLPWVKVEKEYVLDTPEGKRTLAGLFDGRSQLIIYHFMFGPGWEEGCVGCSFLADHIDGANQHLRNHDVTLVVVARAPLPEIEAFKHRMGWGFPWVSSFGSDFNYDFHVSFTKEQLAAGKVFYNFELRDCPVEELAGTSVFARDEKGAIFHTYSAFARGDEQLLGAYHYLELTPKGRNETGPAFDLTDWVRHHDRYHENGTVDRTGRYVAPAKAEPCCATANGNPR
jgi:predicted dithiol-disulfide oxidoreductase (DUF899 family)